MTKPVNYGQTCVLVRNMPYQCDDEQIKGMSSGGVLGKGQVVWVEPQPNVIRSSAREEPMSISGYVEHIGVVSLDPRYLSPMSVG